MSSPSESATLFRAGDPSEGVGFWTPDESYARYVHPEGTELHSAVLLPAANVRTLKECVGPEAIKIIRASGSCDVLVVPALGWPAKEFYVFTPTVLKILK